MLVALPRMAAGTIYYVGSDGSGDDTALGTSWATALATVTNGVAKAVVAGDEVVLSNGMHTLTSEVYIDKRITVRGWTGNREDVIVNGNYPNTTNRCFNLNIAPVGTLVADLTITNGYDVSGGGGGIRIYRNSSIRNCLITGNESTSTGGGIYILQGGLATNCAIIGNVGNEGGGVLCHRGTVIDCLISNNVGKGGGVRLAGDIHGTAVVDNCEILNNRGAYGGGLAVYGGPAGDAIVTNCLIQGNVIQNAKYAGGAGVYLDAGTVVDCDIIGNCTGTNSAYLGGGLVLTGPDPQFVYDCTIISNVSQRGGGVCVDESATPHGVIRNCLIAYNSTTTNKTIWGSADGRGGGIDLKGTAAWVVNCTVVSNVGAEITGGLYGDNNGGSVVNCIIYDNYLTNGTLDNVGWDVGGDETAFTNCCTVPIAGLPGSGNIDGDPLFVDAAAGNFRLTYISPCRNAGLNQSWMSTALDLDGNARLDPHTLEVDIGAYENHELPPRGTLFMIR